jgi:hypothetical protein
MKSCFDLIFFWLAIDWLCSNSFRIVVAIAAITESAIALISAFFAAHESVKK